MGAWGTAIFSDDTAADIRGDYKDHIGDGLDPIDAKIQLLDEWKELLTDPEESNVIWLSLAVTQWNLGRLDEDTKNKALEIINSGADLIRWEGSDKRKRKIVLEKVKETLISSQPNAKKVPKRFRDSCGWSVGELLVYTLTSGHQAIFRVVGFHEDKGGRSPVVEIINWFGLKLPSKFRMRFMKVKKHIYPNGHVISQFMLGRSSEKELPKERVLRLNMRLKPSQKLGGFTVMSWKSLDEFLKDYFKIE